MVVEMIEVSVPQYRLDVPPDYLAVGRIVDAAIERALPDGQYIYRAIGLDDHPGFTAEKLVEVILRTGTDKYDPARKEVCFEDFCMYDHDLHAGDFAVQDHRILLDSSYEYPTLFGDTVKKFYENVLLDRGYRVRIDLLIIYDAGKLERARKVDPHAPSARPETEACLYKFRDPDRKEDAVVGIVRILR